MMSTPMRSPKPCILAVYWLVSCLACHLPATATEDGVAIQGQAQEVSALESTNVTLHCDLTLPEDIDHVLWKKIEDAAHDRVLVHNNHTTNGQKYGVALPHCLVILGMSVDDEGLYQCQINQRAARTVLHMMDTCPGETGERRG
ncbi:hypothetical protein ACOMHN_013530 [Nucella lapillus]